jgi:MoaA/NifB/PqqE/SkfB family radical SAM enzyme
MTGSAHTTRSVFSNQLPTQVYIEVSNRCNSRCISCPITFDQFIDFEPKNNLGMADFYHIVDQFPYLERAVLHGVGEPLLNKDLHKFIAYLKRKNVSVVFNTNAILLDNARGDALVDAGLDELRVSLDAVTPELYAQLRGVDRFQHVVDNLERFIKRHGGIANPKLSLWWVAMQSNLPQLPDFVRLAGRIGSREIHMQRLVYFGNGEACGEKTTMKAEQSLYSALEKEQLDLITESETIASNLGLVFNASGNTTPAKSISSTKAHPWQACTRPWTLMYITANGNALPCCISPFASKDYARLILGNVFQQLVQAVWNDIPYQDLRAAVLSESPAPWPCQYCGVRWSL